MTIELTKDQFYEQFQEANEEEIQWDSSDKLDITYKFDTQISEGWWRKIWLRKGIQLEINKAQHCDRIVVNYSETECPSVYCCFTLLGKLQNSFQSKPNEILFYHISGKYILRSNGLQSQNICDCSNAETYSELQILIQPSIIHSFAVSPEGALPKNLQHLVRSPSQEVYIRFGDTQLMMTAVLQQILHCPYQGMVKRAYLESKVIELIALVLDHEVAIQQGEAKKEALKPEQLERVHYAREILLRDLSNPPSLADLAQQVGLNDFILRQGFRQAFDTTVFGQLQAHRLEVAKQLLTEQDISVSEVAHRVGYASMSYFSRAFKRKFGIGPKAYQKACR